MYPKTITEKIVEYWALGFSAEETRKALEETQGKKACLDTIYRHRHSLTAQNLIDELIRRQERAIFKADTDMPEVGMKYRNELLKILLPQKIEAVSYEKIDENVTVNVTENEDEILSKASAILARKDRFNKIH
jgi:hypothetical protein